MAAFLKGVAAGSTDGVDKTAALDQIILDYTEDSVVRVFNDDQPGKGLELYSGTANITAFFKQLFTDLDGCDGDKLNVGDLRISENPYGNVLLAWQCKVAGFDYATDTFIMKGSKIIGQNIVVSKPAPAPAPTPVPPAASVRSSSEGPYSPSSVQAAWDNHFGAFAAQNVSQIMLDYDSESSIKTFDWNGTETTSSEYKGVVEIQQFFTDLFARIGTAAPGVPLDPPVVVERKDEKMVFLVWNAPDATISKATDTFIFDDNFKIKRQTVVSVTAAKVGKLMIV